MDLAFACNRKLPRNIPSVDYICRLYSSRSMLYGIFSRTTLYTQFSAMQPDLDQILGAEVGNAGKVGSSRLTGPRLLAEAGDWLGRGLTKVSD
jgi:hypothetical protein